MFKYLPNQAGGHELTRTISSYVCIASGGAGSSASIAVQDAQLVHQQQAVQPVAAAQPVAIYTVNDVSPVGAQGNAPYSAAYVVPSQGEQSAPHERAGSLDGSSSQPVMTTVKL